MPLMPRRCCARSWPSVAARRRCAAWYGCRPGRGERLSREREQLIKERMSTGSRASQGIYDYQPLKADRVERLDELRTGDGEPLPDRLRNEIRRQLERLKLLLALIETVEAERDAVVKADKP